MKAPRYTREDAVCPSCGSHERHRALISFLDKNESMQGVKVLDIAPVEIIKIFLEKKGASYFSMDMFTKAMVKGDLRKVPFQDGSFDLILCYHVLEHIREDGTALKELRRICSTDGRIYVQVPMDMSLAETVEYEKPDSYCHDHVRMYGVDFPERISKAGLFFRPVDFGKALAEKERILFGCYKDTGLSYICTRE